MPRKNTRAIGAQPWGKKPLPRQKPKDAAPEAWVQPGALCWYKSAPNLEYAATISGQPWQLGDGTWVVRLVDLPAAYVTDTGRDIVFSAGLWALAPRKRKPDFAVHVGAHERVFIGQSGYPIINAVITDPTPPKDTYGMIVDSMPVLPAHMMLDDSESRLLAAKAQLKIATDALERILGLDDYDTKVSKVSKVADDALDEIRKTK